MSETNKKGNSKNFQRIIQFKVDDSKIDRGKFSNTKRDIDAVRDTLSTKMETIRAEVIEEMNTKIKQCTAMCENLMDIVNAIAEVLDDHKRQIEELGK